MHNKAQEKIAPLTGLRFFAAAAIVIAHCTDTGFLLPRNLFGPFNPGGAVPLFFVLSGFILTVNGMRGRTWTDFMVNRFARIWPAHMASILLLFAMFWPWSLAYFETTQSVVSLALNIGLLHDLFPVLEIYGGYNAPSWSLSAEMIYYAAFPFLAAVMSRRPIVTTVTVLVGVVSTMAAVPILFPGIDRGWLNSMNFVSGCWSFTVGVLAGTIYQRREVVRGASMVEVGVLVLAIAANGWLTSVRIPGHPGITGFVMFHAAAPAYALLIFVLASSRGIVARTLSCRPLVYLGEVSFSLYLVHQLVIRRTMDQDAILFAGWPRGTPFVFVAAVSLLVAMAFYHLIEMPARRAIVSTWKRRKDEAQSARQMAA